MKRRRTDVRAEPGRIGVTGIYGLTATLRDFLLRRGLRNERKDKEYYSGSNIWSGNRPLSSHVRRPTPGRSGLHETRTLEGETRREETGRLVSLKETRRDILHGLSLKSETRRGREPLKGNWTGKAGKILGVEGARE